MKWEAQFGVGSIGPNGVALGYGMVYAGLSDTAEVVALDAATGSEIWRQRIGSPPGEGIDMAPIVYDGLVYISTVPGTGLGSFYAGGDRGVLYALDAVNGEVAWWWDTTGDNNSWGNARLARRRRPLVPALHRRRRQHLLRRRQPGSVADDPGVPERLLPPGR